MCNPKHLHEAYVQKKGLYKHKYQEGEYFYKEKGINAPFPGQNALQIVTGQIRRRSFETTVKLRPITGSRRLKSNP